MHASVTVDQTLSVKLYEALMRCYTGSIFKSYEKDDDMDGFSPQFLAAFD